MKTKLFLTLIITVSMFSSGYAQGIVNSGAFIGISSGTHVYIDNGNYLNQTNTTEGRIDLDGTLYVEGNFTNNAANNVFINSDADGTVVFNGAGTQTITSNAANMSNFINFEAVTVSSGSTVLAAGSAATTNGALTVNAGGTFRLASPADGEAPSGSLITNGTVSGAGALYVDRHFETSIRYQYVSMPVNNATDDLFDQGQGAAFNPNLYTYNETYNASVDPPNTNYSNWSSATYGLYNAWTQVAANGTAVALSGNAIGYITYNDTELDINFGGSPANLNNAASYSPTVSYTLNDDGGGAGNYFDGWNIIGNPYPCAVDFTALSLNNINTCVYYWDGDLDNYKYYNNGGTTYDDGSNIVGGGTRYIPAMQAFAVKTISATSPSVTFDKADRVHNNQTMWKSENKSYNTQFIRLKTENNSKADETVVRFLQEAINDFDYQYDAFKMFSNNEAVPMIYSLTTETVEYPLAINSLPISSVGTSIPLGFKTGEAGKFTIEVAEFNFDAGTEVKLVDTELDKEIILEEGTEYSFSFDGADNRTRFYLFYSSQGSGVEDELPNNDNIEYSSNVWSNGNNVYITVSSLNLLNANVQIFDITGRTIIDQYLSGAYNIINVSGASGTYIVKLRTKDGKTRTDKVNIQK
jgi:hypothetical protein